MGKTNFDFVLCLLLFRFFVINPILVRLTTVPSSCLLDPNIKVCEYDATTYPSSFVDTVLLTYKKEMKVLLKYANPVMLKVVFFNKSVKYNK